MIRAVLVSAIVLAATPAEAQDAAVAWSCQPSQGRMVIQFYPSLSNADPAVEKLKPLRFYDLLDVSAKSMVTRTRRQMVPCQLTKNRYEVTFGPGVPNPNLLGRCGGEITGVITIRRNGVLVLEDREFEDMNCHQRERYITTITLVDSDDVPAIKYATYEPAAAPCASIPR